MRKIGMVVMVLMLIYPVTAFSKVNQNQQNQNQQSQMNQQGQTSQLNQQNQMNSATSQSQNLQIVAALTTAVKDRRPVDNENYFRAGIDSVIFWNNILGARGNTHVTQEWFFNGRRVALVDLPVRNWSWRTWSYKTLSPNEAGEWMVQTVEPNGDVIASATTAVIARS